MLSSIFDQIKIAEPLGVCTLASILRRKGVEINIVEPSVDGWGAEETAEKVASLNSRIVALSMHRDKNIGDVLKFVRRVRECSPDAFIVVGGHGPSISVNNLVLNLFKSANKSSNPNIQKTERNSGHCSNNVSNSIILPPDDSKILPKSSYFEKSREYLDILKYIDTYMIGECDSSFPELVELVLSGQDWRNIPGIAYLDNNELRFTSPAEKETDLSSLPHMSRDVYEQYQSKYKTMIPASLVASRGCFYRCTFCSVVKFNNLQAGPKHRVRSNQDLISEIKNLYYSYGTTAFNIEDDNFITNSRARINVLHDFCDMILSLPFKINFTFFCRSDSVTKDLFSHFKHAGLNGVYFGMESIHQSDLDFYHKGLSSKKNFDALNILYDLGFSAEVDSQSRIMLGYITWHPLTTLDSLEATSNFIKEYKAPPKLLRRKLRLYSGTEALDIVKNLGLLNAANKDGWDFKYGIIEQMNLVIEEYFSKINKIRDKLRTLEKAVYNYNYNLMNVNLIRKIRQTMDNELYDFFDSITELAVTENACGKELVRFAENRSLKFNEYLRQMQVNEIISEAFLKCNFSFEITDLFRK